MQIPFPEGVGGWVLYPRWENGALEALGALSILKIITFV